VSDYTVRRGGWGKPWVTTDGQPLDFGEDGELDKPRNGLLYDRPSDIAGYLDSKENLSPYHQAQAVLGVVTERSASLVASFRALASEFADPWSEAKDEVKDYLRQARRLGGEDAKSNKGTSIHRYCHLRDIGQRAEFEIPAMEPWLDEYERAMARYEVLEDERFVVCDELRSAGSFDRLVRDKETGEVLIADIKSGAHDVNYALKPTVQTALYAHSEFYDQATGKREGFDCSLTHALLIHVPFNGGGTPRCEVYRLDIIKGWELAKIAVQIPAARKIKCNKRSRVYP
jgi:hypothetical protein